MSKVQSQIDKDFGHSTFDYRLKSMAAITSFEDIEAWRQARELTKVVYAITSSGNFARDFGLKDQIRRASVSIMSNIAEGFERGGDKEFRQFLAFAKGSAGEVRAQLYVALDAGFLDRENFDQLYKMTSDVGRLISGFMRYLNASDYKGSKYKPHEPS